jgi:predicted unusual protein kinase regulating ubiquinone biosynthesis (AarF/ABC1/UbiB family)
VLERPALPRTSFARLRALGGLSGRLGVSYALTRLRGLFAREARRKALVEAYHERSAQRVLATAGQLKGALMKLAQIASYAAESLPPDYRESLASPQSPGAEVWLEHAGPRTA